ncbi:MAG: hypothetical protein QW133_05260 [Sulfolobales archaeon]
MRAYLIFSKTLNSLFVGGLSDRVNLWKSRVMFLGCSFRVIGGSNFMVNLRRLVSPFMLVLVATSWFIRSVFEKDAVAAVVGLALLLGSISYVLQAYVINSSKNEYWKLIEVGLTVLVPIVIIVGYFITGSALLMILTLLITLLIILGITLSCVIPRIRREV